MRIAFANLCGWDFHAQSPDTTPLGGTQSAACYLAQALARRGHEVFLLTRTTVPGNYAGVHCLPLQTSTDDFLRSLRFDFFVCLLLADFHELARRALGAGPRLILWTQHNQDQPAVRALADPTTRAAYDGIALVSDWQRLEFLRHFQLDPARTRVLRNAPAPAFLSQAADPRPILSRKITPPILAYASAPYRGLDVLLDAFPRIRAAVPGTRLRVYSSMQVYKTPPIMDQIEFGALYQRCHTMAGVEYIGSLPQPALANQLQSIFALAYPSIFAETSCIVALEAMASGCRIITSDLGALPETTAGFAALVPHAQSRDNFVEAFAQQTIAVLREREQDPAGVEARLRQQVATIMEHGTWDARAAEWDRWLAELPPR